MATNKNKQNLRYQKVSERINKKVRYDGFSKEEITYLKTKEKYEQVEKELNVFWKEAPRNENGVVNWSAMSEETLDYFEYINKQSEKLLRRLNKLEDNGIDVQQVTKLFIQLNCNSISF
jgi:hypothetical protein